MFSAIQTCTLVGFEVHPVICEVHLANQLPTFTLVGLASSITQESRERVRSAVVNSGLDWPARKVTINLLPAALPKWGSHFELAMALGVLCAGRMQRPVFALGELSLSGDVRPCGWVGLAAAHLKKVAKEVIRKNRVKLLVVAAEWDLNSLKEHLDAEALSLLEFQPVQKLGDAFSELQKLCSVKLVSSESLESTATAPLSENRDFSVLSRVQNEPLAVVAALCALRKRHHILLAGPQGVGKSMAAQGIAQALLPLQKEEAASRSILHAMFGEAAVDFEKQARPVIRLQSGVTRQALEGSLLDSGRVLPGELTRAHCGVLVADEFLELHRDVIEALRQPLEEKCVRLSRAKLRTVLPADFQLLATTNLCPCGYLSSTRRKCRCALASARSYLTKLSGPMLDRFDLIVLLGEGLDSERLRERCRNSEVLKRVQWLADSKNWNAGLRASSKNAAAEVGNGRIDLFPPDTSPRAQQKMLAVAATLADLCSEQMSEAHLGIAALLRTDLDRIVREHLGFLTRAS